MSGGSGRWSWRTGRWWGSGDLVGIRAEPPRAGPSCTWRLPATAFGRQDPAIVWCRQLPSYRTAHCDNHQPVDKEGPGSDADVSAMPPLTGRSYRSKVGLRGHCQDVGPFARGVITGRLGGATPREVFAVRSSEEVGPSVSVWTAEDTAAQARGPWLMRRTTGASGTVTDRSSGGRSRGAAHLSGALAACAAADPSRVSCLRPSRPLSVASLTHACPGCSGSRPLSWHHTRWTIDRGDS